MSSIRNYKEKTSRRKRECYQCGHNISENTKYRNIEVRYDKTIITLSKCMNCTDFDIFELPDTFMKQIKKFVNLNTRNENER